MRNAHLLAAIGLLFPTGCGLESRIESFDAGYEKLVIERNASGLVVARKGGEILPVQDCSTTDLLCMNISGQFGFIFPRRCPAKNSEAPLAWSVAGFKTFYAAPYPDIGKPSGIYMTSLSEKVSYDYDTKNGLTHIVIAKRPAINSDYNRGDYEGAFKILFPDRAFHKFVCK